MRKATRYLSILSLLLPITLSAQTLERQTPDAQPATVPGIQAEAEIEAHFKGDTLFLDSRGFIGNTERSPGFTISVIDAMGEAHEIGLFDKRAVTGSRHIAIDLPSLEADLIARSILEGRNNKADDEEVIDDTEYYLRAYAVVHTDNEATARSVGHIKVPYTQTYDLSAGYAFAKIAGENGNLIADDDCADPNNQPCDWVSALVTNKISSVGFVYWAESYATITYRGTQYLVQAWVS